MFDIDNFKIINESLGHAMGDEIMRTTASRLEGAMRPGDTLARLAGGEFAVLCEHLPSAEAAGYIADRMLGAAPRAHHDLRRRAGAGGERGDSPGRARLHAPPSCCATPTPP